MVIFIAIKTDWFGEHAKLYFAAPTFREVYTRLMQEQGKHFYTSVIRYDLVSHEQYEVAEFQEHSWNSHVPDADVAACLDTPFRIGDGVRVIDKELRDFIEAVGVRYGGKGAAFRLKYIESEFEADKLEKIDS